MSAPGRWLLSLDGAEPWRDERTVGLEVARARDTWVAFHGWLYGSQALARILRVPREAVGQEAALVLAAIDRWGLNALARLRGAFVIAVGNGTTREVVVARDPLGSHPLFFTAVRGRVVFSESTHALRDLPGATRDFNRAALADHLCHRWPHREETFFAGIGRVPPGSLIRVSQAGCRTDRYWDPAPLDRPIQWVGQEAARLFPALLDQAVSRCLENGPAAIFLSGGLDSISIAARAADLAHDGSSPPWALSLAMNDPSCDERATQTAVATALGLPIRLVEFSEAVGERGLVDEASRLGRQLSSPLLNIWAPAYLKLATLSAADGVRTILSGSGGDEWLSVSPYLSADLIARGDIAEWWRFFQAFRRSYRHPLWRHAKLAAWTFGARPLASRVAARWFGAAWQARRGRRAVLHDPTWAAPDLQLRKELNARAAGSLEDPEPAQGFYAREMRSGLDHPLTSWELEEQYEFGIRTGQRFVHPYWDPDLVDMLYRTPPPTLIEGGRGKGLVRGSLAQRFPGVGLENQRKVPGTNFYRALVSSGLPVTAREIGDCRMLAELGVITADAARDYSTAGFGSATNGWDLVNLETWVRANA